MKIASTISRYLLGLLFTVFGLNGFFNFIHQPPPPNPLALQFLGAVVVPGSRAITRGRAAEWGLSLYAPVIVKYRDDKTDLSAALEDLLR